jgi:hypothetical protein
MNEPAFPVLGDRVSPVTGIPLLDCKHEGMSLRDYFAGQALIALCHHKYPTEDLELLYGTDSISEAAYKQADAMLAVREPNYERPRNLHPDQVSDASTIEETIIEHQERTM